MRNMLGQVIKRGLFSLGHYADQLHRDTFPGVAVLAYHGVRTDDEPHDRVAFEDLHVRADELEAQCRFIREACDPITLDQWRSALDGGPPLPARPVLVTFDDGYLSVLTLARPILERYRIPTVVFICSGPIQHRRLLWYDAIARAWGEQEVERLKGLPYAEWRALCSRYEAPAVETDPYTLLTPADVKALAETPGVEIGGHGAEHAILAQGSDEDQRMEIARNKEALEGWSGRDVRAFAYPNGRPGKDYTVLTTKLLEQHGFDFGFTTSPGFAGPHESRLEVRRFLMLAGITAAELGHRLVYSWRR